MLNIPATTSNLETSPVHPEPSPSHIGRPGTIMFIDDEKIIRDMACEALKAFGYTTLSFGKAGKAIDHYRQHANEIDLVILDLSMPELSGEECFRAMKAINPGIKAVISSGHSLDEAIGNLLADGVCSFLPKPFNLDKLAETVQKALG